MSKKPGWVYCYSELLKLKFAIHEETGWVYFEDGVRYSPEEIDTIKQSGGMIDIAIHSVKKSFNGEIVKNETKPNIGANNNERELDIY
jgi:hypothetical protein